MCNQSSNSMDWSDLNSAQVSDALEEAGLPQTVLHGFMRLDSGVGPTFGPAFTIQQEAKSHAEPRSHAQVKHGAAIRDTVPPGCVVIIDNAGRSDAATWGSNHTRRSGNRALAGTIIFGATRDVEEIAAGDYPVYATSVSPIKSRWTTKTVALNRPITIGETQIAPGDLIFADRTGICVVPAGSVEAVFRLATAIRMREAAAASEEAGTR